MAFSADTTDLLSERMQELPVEVTRMLQDNSIREYVLKIQKEFKLSDKETVILENEIALIVLVLVPFESLYERLTLFTDLPTEKVTSIIQKTYSELLIDIIPLLVSIENEESKEEHTENEKGGLPKGKKEEYERLHLRPEEKERPTAPAGESSGAKPLTKDDLMNSLSPKRTMQSDISHLKGGESENKKQDGEDQ